MSRTAALLGLLITFLAGTFYYLNLCSECRPSESKTEPVPINAPLPKVTGNPFWVEDGEFGLKTNDNFNFAEGSATIEMPLSAPLLGAIDQLKRHLDSFPDRNLHITGLYDSRESNNSPYPNLGIARATSIKNFLAEIGVATQRMDLDGEARSALPQQDGIWLGPLALGLQASQTDADKTAELQELYAKITSAPLSLHFETGQHSIAMDSAQRQQVAQIARYLDLEKDASLHIVGHTDNTGTPEKNMQLGQERADFLKGYFVGNGIPVARITTTSMGETQPIASNATPEGKRQNRRADLQLNTDKL